jgi:hypothetical protein
MIGFVKNLGEGRTSHLFKNFIHQFLRFNLHAEHENKLNPPGSF